LTKEFGYSQVIVEAKKGKLLRTVINNVGVSTKSFLKYKEISEGLLSEGIYDQTWLQQREMPPVFNSQGLVRAVDLFAGCGGLSVGVREACRALQLDFEAVLAVDFDSTVLETYASNFPEASIVCQPIEDLIDGKIGSPLTPKELKLKRKLGVIDIVIGGPPCQGHSALNNHTRHRDPKNELYLIMARFCEIIRPRHVVIENVPGVLSDSLNVAQRTWDALSKLGYSVDSGVIDASKIGVAQRRKRSITVASLDGTPLISAVIKNAELPNRPLRWAIGDLAKRRLVDCVYDSAPSPSVENSRRINYLFDNNLHDLPDEERPDCHRLKAHTYKSVYGRMYWDKPAQTITTGFGSMGRGRNVHPRFRRTITPHEAARIQFFPDFFRFETELRTQLQKMIGNAVPSKLGYVIALYLFA